jgi:hypothetical protein
LVSFCVSRYDISRVEATAPLVFFTLWVGAFGITSIYVQYRQDLLSHARGWLQFFKQAKLQRSNFFASLYAKPKNCDECSSHSAHVLKKEVLQLYFQEFSSLPRRRQMMGWLNAAGATVVVQNDLIRLQGGAAAVVDGRQLTHRLDPRITCVLTTMEEKHAETQLVLCAKSDSQVRILTDDDIKGLLMKRCPGQKPQLPSTSRNEGAMSPEGASPTSRLPMMGNGSPAGTPRARKKSFARRPSALVVTATTSQTPNPVSASQMLAAPVGGGQPPGLSSDELDLPALDSEWGDVIGQVPFAELSTAGKAAQFARAVEWIGARLDDTTQTPNPVGAVQEFAICGTARIAEKPAELVSLVGEVIAIDRPPIGANIDQLKSAPTLKTQSICACVLVVIPGGLRMMGSGDNSKSVCDTALQCFFGHCSFEYLVSGTYMLLGWVGMFWLVGELKIVQFRYKRYFVALKRFGALFNHATARNEGFPYYIPLDRVENLNSWFDLRAHLKEDWQGHVDITGGNPVVLLPGLLVVDLLVMFDFLLVKSRGNVTSAVVSASKQLQFCVI